MSTYIVAKTSTILVARLYFPHGQSALLSQRLYKAFNFRISLGHFGVIGSNCIPNVSIYLANSVLLNRGPLSEMT